MSTDKLEKFGERWKAARSQRVRVSTPDLRDCHVIDCGTDDAAVNAIVAIADVHPDLLVKRHRKRRSVLLVWCFATEWDSIQSAIVMASLGSGAK